MSKKKSPQPTSVPPPAKNGVKTRFDAATEHYIREQAKNKGFAKPQDYIRDLVRKDRIGEKP